jgi:methylmalonyl-CoA mutase
VEADASVPPLAGGDDLPANRWSVRQDVSHPDIDEAVRLAGKGLDRGADALGLITRMEGDQIRGVPLQSQREVGRFLDGLPRPLPPLHLSDGPEAVAVYRMIASALGADEALRGSVEFDPTGALAVGALSDPETAFALGADLVRSREDHPQVRTWAVSTAPYHDAGASIVQELAAALGALSEALARFTDRGIDLQEAVDALHVVVPVSTGYFLEIAKLRALRLLLSQVVDAFAAEADADLSLKPSDVFLQARTSRRSHSRYNPYVNMLRGTTEAMAAVIGGCDVLSVDRYDARQRSPGDFSERIARNTQLILREETHADHVADPAAGSYYIEAATDQVARRAWSLFQDLEAEGGLVAALQSGTLADRIATVRTRREEEIEHRDRVLVGTNHYPDLSETLGGQGAGGSHDASSEQTADEARLPSPSRTPARRSESTVDLSAPSLDALRRAFDWGATLADVSDALRTRGASGDGEAAAIDPLPVTRLSDGFDRLRLRTERYADETGSAPTIFLAPLGHPSMRSARSNFARNFFGVAGFDIVENLRFERPEDAVDAAIEEAADVIVLCSSDAEYADLVPNVRSALASAPIDPLLVVAGNAEKIEGDIAADGFVHLGSPLLDTLRAYQDRLMGG